MMKQYLLAQAILLTALICGCGDKQPPVVQIEPPAKELTKKAPVAPPDPVDEPEPPKQPQKKNNSKPQNQGNKNAGNKPANKAPAFVKPKPGFAPLALPNVPAAPAGYAGKNEADDAELPVETQQKLNSDQPAQLLEVLRTSPYPKARNLAAGELDDDDYKANRDEIVLALRGTLRDPNHDVIKTAIYSLRNMKAHEALGDIAGFVFHPDKELQEASLNAIKFAGTAALPVVEPLALALRDPDYPAEIYLYDAVAELGPQAAPHVLEQLKQKLKTEDIFREYVCEAIAGVGAEKELLEVLKNKDADIRKDGALGSIKLATHGPEIVTQMIKMLKSEKNESTREALAEALGKVRPLTPEVVAAFAGSAKDKVEKVRRLTAEALGAGEPKLPAAIPVLQALSKDAEDSVRRVATDALLTYQTKPEDRLFALLDQAHGVGYFSSDSKEALEKSSEEFLPKLLTIINDPQETATRRAAAVLALDELEFKEEVQQQRQTEIKDLMRKLLADESLSVLIRAAAAPLLFDYENPQAGAAAVAALTNPESKMVQKAAIEWVSRTSNKKGIPGLIQVAQGSDKDLARKAIGTLSYFGPDAASAVPALAKLAENEDTNSYFTSDVISALRRIAAQPQVCLPVLEKYAYDKKAKRKGDAVQALCEIVGKNEMDPLPTLRKVFLMIAEVEPEDRDDYIEALGLMGPKAAPTVGRLVEFLSNDEKNVRTAAASALGNIGPEAKAAALPLVNMANTANHDKEFEVYIALSALRRIKAGGPELAKIAGTIVMNKDLHDDVLETLTVFGPEAAAAAPVVIELLPKLSEDDHSDAWDCLKAMGPAAVAVAPAIEAYLPKITDDRERRDAQAALKAIKP
jgi:HEAT repeat protein